MNDHDPSDIRVSVSLLDMLAEIRKDQAAGFARLEVTMSGKADKADVARMEARLDAHSKALDEHRTSIAELQVQAREEIRARNVQAQTNQWWHTRMAKAGGFIVGLALVLTAIVTIIRLFH